MRSTKSKLRLAYHKYLLSIEKRRTELSYRKPDEENYIEIPRILIGYKIKLIPVDSLKNHDEGLAEAVEEDLTFVVTGSGMDRLIDSVNFEDQESLNWFHRTLRRLGVIDALRDAGAQEGSSVRIGDMEFDFVE